MLGESEGCFLARPGKCGTSTNIDEVLLTEEGRPSDSCLASRCPGLFDLRRFFDCVGAHANWFIGTLRLGSVGEFSADG